MGKGSSLPQFPLSLALAMLVLLTTRFSETEACVVVEKDTNFDDFALRSSVVVEGTLERNVAASKPRFSALFRVTHVFSEKSEGLENDDIITVGQFGSSPTCVKPKFGKKYILFLNKPQQTPGGIRRFVNRYNIVGSSGRNLKFFSSVLNGSYSGETILRSGCRQLPKPVHGSTSCSQNKVKCVVKCNDGFSLDGGAKFKSCQATTGLWFPFKIASCVSEINVTTTVATNLNTTLLTSKQITVSPTMKLSTIIKLKANTPKRSPVSLKKTGTAKKATPKKPGTAKRPVTARKPGTAKRPVTARKPGTAKRPVTARKPGTAKRPVTAKKPGTAKRPTTAKKTGKRPTGKRPVRRKKPTGKRPVRRKKPTGKRPVRGKKPAGKRPVRGKKPAGKRPVRRKKPAGKRLTGKKKNPIGNKKLAAKRPGAKTRKTPLKKPGAKAKPAVPHRRNPNLGRAAAQKALALKLKNKKLAPTPSPVTEAPSNPMNTTIKQSLKALTGSPSPPSLFGINISLGSISSTKSSPSTSTSEALVTTVNRRATTEQTPPPRLSKPSTGSTKPKTPKPTKKPVVTTIKTTTKSTTTKPTTTIQTTTKPTTTKATTTKTTTAKPTTTKTTTSKPTTVKPILTTKRQIATIKPTRKPVAPTKPAKLTQKTIAPTKPKTKKPVTPKRPIRKPVSSKKPRKKPISPRKVPPKKTKKPTKPVVTTKKPIKTTKKAAVTTKQTFTTKKHVATTAQPVKTTSTTKKTILTTKPVTTTKFVKTTKTTPTTKKTILTPKPTKKSIVTTAPAKTTKQSTSTSKEVKITTPIKVTRKTPPPTKPAIRKPVTPKPAIRKPISPRKPIRKPLTPRKVPVKKPTTVKKPTSVKKPPTGRRPAGQRKKPGAKGPVKKPKPGAKSPVKRPKPGAKGPVKKPRPGPKSPIKRPKLGAKGSVKKPKPGAKSPVKRPKPGAKGPVKKPRPGPKSSIKRPKLGAKGSVKKPKPGTKRPIKRPKPGAKGSKPGALRPVPTAAKPTARRPFGQRKTTPKPTVKVTPKPTTTKPPTTTTEVATTTVLTTRKTTTTKPTTTTPKTRPVMPTYRPLQPITRRSAFPSRRPMTSLRPLPRFSRLNQPRPTARSQIRSTAHTRPPLPVYRPLAPLTNRHIFPRPRINLTPTNVAILKKVPNAPVLGEELEQIDDKFAVAADGDTWTTDDGLSYEPELVVNKTVYGCPKYESELTVFSVWQGGFNAMVNFSRLNVSMITGWMVRIQFEEPIVNIRGHVVNFYVGTDDRKTVCFTPKPYMAILHENQDLTVAFVADTEPDVTYVPRAKAYLLGRCIDDELGGKVVGNMFQGHKVVETFGDDAKAKDVPSAPTRAPTKAPLTTKKTHVGTGHGGHGAGRLGEQTPPPRPKVNPANKPAAKRPWVRPKTSAGNKRTTGNNLGQQNARQTGQNRPNISKPKPGRNRANNPNKRTGTNRNNNNNNSNKGNTNKQRGGRRAKTRSVFTPKNSQDSWPFNRCLKDSVNGVLPKGGLTRPDWIKTNSKKSIYDYNEVLHKSGLFYLAQKSGKLPKLFPIPWRSDSALKDGCVDGENLQGGMYSGAGHEKSTMAIAFTTTMLAWGGIDYRAAYEASGEYNNLVKLVKSLAKYLIRCHTDDNELVVQVGKHQSSETSWSRPEEIDENGRVVYKIDSENPGQDVAAETAAALAAAAIMFKSSDYELSKECLLHAKQIYTFARKYPGKYSLTFPESVNNYYTTSSTLDDLIWALLWIGRATGSSSYMNVAEIMYKKIPSGSRNNFNWEDKTTALPILFAKFAKRPHYKWEAKRILRNIMVNATRTPSNQVWLSETGTNMHTANSAFLSLQIASLFKETTFANVAASYAEEQLHLLLGDSGRSYVIGFGNQYPKRPHHMASSCFDSPAICDIRRLSISADSPHTLYGALVGGPDQNGKYRDFITERVQNEVAIEFNAGFQSAIAGLRDMQLPGKSMISSQTNKLSRVGQPVRKSSNG